MPKVGKFCIGRSLHYPHIITRGKACALACGYMPPLPRVTHTAMAASKVDNQPTRGLRNGLEAIAMAENRQSRGRCTCFPYPCPCHVRSKNSSLKVGCFAVISVQKGRVRTWKTPEQAIADTNGSAVTAPFLFL